MFSGAYYGARDGIIGTAQLHQEDDELPESTISINALLCVGFIQTAEEAISMNAEYYLENDGMCKYPSKKYKVGVDAL